MVLDCCLTYVELRRCRITYCPSYCAQAMGVGSGQLQLTNLGGLQEVLLHCLKGLAQRMG